MILSLYHKKSPKPIQTDTIGHIGLFFGRLCLFAIGYEQKDQTVIPIRRELSIHIFLTPFFKIIKKNAQHSLCRERYNGLSNRGFQFSILLKINKLQQKILFFKPIWGIVSVCIGLKRVVSLILSVIYSFSVGEKNMIVNYLFSLIYNMRSTIAFLPFKHIKIV